MTKIQEEFIFDKLKKLEKEIEKLKNDKENSKLSNNLYSVAETARMIERTPQAVYAMIERGELEAVKLGSTKIIASSLKKVLGHEI